MKVAVLMGGKSFEREVSLASGKVVCEALEEAGHKVVPLDTNADLVPTLRSERPDVVYNALHGKHGEDGTIQSLLEFLGIPFVGSPASVCHRAWNKDALHSSLAKYRDLTGEEGCASWPQGVYLARDAFKGMGAATALDMVADRVIGGYPVCVKPAHGGSALGVHKVESQEELGEAVLDALCTETLLEFPCEGVVWWTLIRLDKIWDYNPSLAERRALNPNILLWPISASARNKNTKLTQTEGWN